MITTIGIRRKDFVHIFWEVVFMVVLLPFNAVKRFLCNLDDRWKLFLMRLYGVVSLPIFIYLNSIEPPFGISAILFVMGIAVSGIGVLALIFLLVVLIVYIIVGLYDKIKPKKAKNNKSLLKEFIKAKWNRVCPRLEFVDGDEE